MAQTLREMAAEYGILLDEEMCGRFMLYGELLAQWNQKINLTAITLPEEVNIKHFLDSLLPLCAWEIPQGARLLDVGTGAGFPAVPMKIVRGDLRVTLLDSLNKRILFLKELSEALRQDNVLVHGRAEECGRDSGMRERFDVVTARAVAALSALCEYCLPFVKVGGTFAALKGFHIEEELAQSQSAIKLLGGEVLDVKKYQLPGENERAIVLIKKISQSPPKYPRSGVKIAKAPL